MNSNVIFLLGIMAVNELSGVECLMSHVWDFRYYDENKRRFGGIFTPGTFERTESEAINEVQ